MSYLTGDRIKPQDLKCIPAVAHIAGRGRISCRSRTEACPPGYQAVKHHGEVEGGRRGIGQNHRPWFGENSRRIGF